MNFRVSTSQYKAQSSVRDRLWILILIPALCITLLGKYFFQLSDLFSFRTISLLPRFKKQIGSIPRPASWAESRQYSSAVSYKS